LGGRVKVLGEVKREKRDGDGHFVRGGEVPEVHVYMIGKKVVGLSDESRQAEERKKVEYLSFNNITASPKRIPKEVNKTSIFQEVSKMGDSRARRF